MTGRLGRNPDAEKPVIMTRADAHTLWMRLVHRLRGRKLSAGVLSRAWEGSEPFRWHIEGMAPSADFQAYRPLNSRERSEIFAMLEDRGSPFAVMYGRLAYDLYHAVQQYQGRGGVELVIPRNLEDRADALALRLQGKTQDQTAESLGVDVKTVRRWEQAVGDFYLKLRSLLFSK